MGTPLSWFSVLYVIFVAWLCGMAQKSMHIILYVSQTEREGEGNCCLLVQSRVVVPLVFVMEKKTLLELVIGGGGGVAAFD